MWTLRLDSSRRLSKLVRTWDRETVVSSLFKSVSEGNVVQTLRDRPNHNNNVQQKGKLNWSCEEKNWLSKDYTKLKQKWRWNIEKFWHRFSWDQSRIWIPTITATTGESMGWSDSKRQNKLVWRIGDEEQNLPRKSSKRLPRNWRIEKICCEETDSSKTSKNWWIVCASREESYDCESIVDSNTGFTKWQNKVNSLSDARESDDPEKASSSGATHVPSQPSTFASPRTTLCRDSGLPHDAQNIVCTSGNVFERLPAQQGRTSTLFNSSKNWASSSQELRPDTGNTKRLESDMWREPLNMSTLVPRFQSAGGLINHNGGTYSHGGMIDYPRFSIS